jgi:UDP-N-acetylglucosamine 2-epimerase (non-hydrolysing)
MKSKVIDIVAGARPNYVKIAPIIRAMDQNVCIDKNIRYRLINTGQHYDPEMSTIFFTDLGIPEPNINFGVGSGSQADQTGRIMLEYEKVIQNERPSAVVVVGDVNSTMACAISASKCQVPVAHVEAGIRSGDMSMPEEINRVVTDRLSRWYFTTSEFADRNLYHEGCPRDNVFRVGNTMIDSLIANQSRFRMPSCTELAKLESRCYWVLTLHRPSNVDSFAKLLSAIRSISRSSGGLPIVFPVHPRTKKMLGCIEQIPPNVLVCDPLGYLEFMYLVRESIGVVTDSGGISEETTYFGLPCITLRENTERPETVSIGTNELVGASITKLELAMNQILDRKWKLGKIPELWDGLASKRIVDVLVKAVD